MAKNKRVPQPVVTHIRKITADTVKALEAKYKRGVQEHGGGLERKPVIDFIGDEVSDMVIYFHVLKEQWNRMKEIASCALQCGGSEGFDFVAVQQIYNILTFGNPEGEEVKGD